VTKPRRDLAESFQQYCARNNHPCTCGATVEVSTLRSPWAHFEGCPQQLLYQNWRLYVEQLFPGRVCKIDLPKDLEQAAGW
jgi:hypothetical protein